MRKQQPQTVALTCHTCSPTAVVRGVSASARIGGAGKLAVRFELDADVGQLMLPPPRTPARVDELYTILASMAQGGPRLATSRLGIRLLSMQGTTEELLRAALLSAGK